MLKARFEKRFKGQNGDVEMKVCEGVKCWLVLIKDLKVQEVETDLLFPGSLLQSYRTSSVSSELIREYRYRMFLCCSRPLRVQERPNTKNENWHQLQLSCEGQDQQNENTFSLTSYVFIHVTNLTHIWSEYPDSWACCTSSPQNIIIYQPCDLK